MTRIIQDDPTHIYFDGGLDADHAFGPKDPALDEKWVQHTSSWEPVTTEFNRGFAWGLHYRRRKQGPKS